MGHRRLAIAAGNRLGASAGANVARAGGNAVDACLASVVMAWVAEPFFASVAGSGFIAVRTPDGAVEIFDGNTSMPHSPPAEPGQGITRVWLDYSNGMYTGIGGGSVGVPGILAAVHAAWEAHGRIGWDALFQDAIATARDGLPFPRTSAYYLGVTFKEIWSRLEASAALFVPEGRPWSEGDLFVQPELADALELIAQRGPDVFYRGEIGRAITDAIQADGGFMTVEDLAAYRSGARTPVRADAFGWTIESNPPPAVGGAGLVHMLTILDRADLSIPLERTRAIVEAQRAAMGYRRDHYHDPERIAAEFEAAIAMVRATASPETTHTSSADADGYVCAATESNGYGAGLVVHGIMLNNTLGEEELNPLGIHALPSGSPCHSNMAPTIASGPDRVVGIGSPGADRIVGAIAQTLVHLALDGDDLQAAVAAPRVHVDMRPDGDLLCYEPGLPGDLLGYNPRPYDGIHMYFGGVQAASVDADGTVDAACDPRRSGGSAVV